MSTWLFLYEFVIYTIIWALSADCSPIAGRAGVREYLFGTATGQEDLCLFAAKDFQAGQGQLITDEVNGGNLFYRMQTVFHYNELMRQDTS